MEGLPRRRPVRHGATFWRALGRDLRGLDAGHSPVAGALGNLGPAKCRAAPGVDRQTSVARLWGPHLDGPLVFLASDASRYLTGHELRVDGGFTA